MCLCVCVRERESNCVAECMQAECRACVTKTEGMVEKVALGVTEGLAAWQLSTRHSDAQRACKQSRRNMGGKSNWLRGLLMFVRRQRTFFFF